MTEKLLPCPFCGSDAFFYNDMMHMYTPRNITAFKVACTKDCVTMPTRHDMWFTSEEEAIKAWNRRVK